MVAWVDAEQATESEKEAGVSRLDDGAEAEREDGRPEEQEREETGWEGGAEI
jgi:hypothetical protein